MDILELKQSIDKALHGSPFEISGSSLGSPAISILLKNYFSNDKLQLSKTKKTRETDEAVMVEGLLLQPFLKQSMLHAAVTFTVDNGDTHITVTITNLPAVWKLSDSFEALKSSVFDDFAYESPTLVLDSRSISGFPANFPVDFGHNAYSENLKSKMFGGLSLRCSLKLATGFDGLGWLFGGSKEWKVVADIEIAQNYPSILLRSEDQQKPLSLAAYDFAFSLNVVNIILEDLSSELYTTSFVQLSSTIKKDLDGMTPLEIPVYCRLHSGDDAIITINSSLANASELVLDQISKLIGNVSIDGQVPDIFPALKDIQLESVMFSVVPRQQKLLNVGATISIKNNENENHVWSVLDDLIVFEGLKVTFTYSPDLESPVQVYAIAEGKLSGGSLDASISLPELDFACELTQESIDISQLIRRMVGDSMSIPSILCTGLNVYGNIKENEYGVRAVLDSETPWNLLGPTNSSLQLKQISLGLFYSPGLTRGNVGGVFLIGGIEFLATASYDGPDAGWQFEGSTGAGQKIPIVKLLEDMSKKLGVDSFKPPESLEKLDIKNLTVSFNTQSKDFSFSGEVDFPVDGKEPVMVLSIEIKRQQDGTYSKHFSGKITIEGMEFDVIFDSKEDATILIAAYQDLNEQSYLIRPLVETISSDFAAYVPESLRFTIKDALLVYDQEKEDKYYLFGIDIDGGLNLSDLKLPDLPLVGSLFPPDQTLKLSFQLLAAKLPDGKANFSPTQVSTVNGLLAAGPKLPNKDIQSGVDISTVLQVGGESKLLALPVGFDKKSAGGETTSLVQAPSSPSADIVSSSTPSAANVNAGKDGLQWINIQKNFGPVHFERIGLAYKDGNITGALDAALMVGPLTVALNGLSVTSPLTKFDPVFDLHGLGIDYRNGPLEIGGAFLKQTITPKVGDPYTAFSGLAVIRTKALSISAIGSYANINDHPSLFIYAVLDYPIGGPSFFFITGLAGGFGYNRGLNIPTIDTLANFPLIEEATRKGGPPKIPAGQQAQQDTLTTELSKLESHIPPEVGQYFLAVGIKFTSFKIIDSFLLLTVQFGRKLEFDLLGLSTVQSPPALGDDTITPVAKAVLALKATFIPDEGILSVQAQLTSDSYILSQACHLTGGFAFFCWFKDSLVNDKIKAGDFVLTLGGYHPDFVIPEHYPRVPRLGINWQVNKPGENFELSIKGDGYFALTPHAVMAGGHLEVLWHMDNLRAWLKAGADFLISWQPYHYDAHMYVDIGASYTFEDFGNQTIKVELGADLHLWGPEFAGTAEIHYYLFSAEIKFGDQTSKALEPLDWESFKKSFLPAEDQICTVAVQGGLIKQIEEDGKQRWIVNPKDLVFVTNTVIPIKSASLITNENPLTTQTLDRGKAKQTLDIAPMGVMNSDKVISAYKITIKRGNDYVPNDFGCSPVLKSVPAALWGEPQMDGKYLKPPKVNPDDNLVKDTVAGYEIQPADPPKAGSSQPMKQDNFSYEIETISGAYKFGNQIVPDLQGEAAWNQADKDIKDPKIRTERERFLSTLGFSVKMQDFGESVKQDVMVKWTS
jgi:hypothetical protein